jgi:hypothetical protein
MGIAEAPMKLGNRHGQMMMGTVLVIGVVAMAFIAAVVYKNMVTSKASVASSKSISAYEIANAAIQKGIWALNLNSDNWNTVGTAGTLTGYDGTTTFTDIPGGSYKLLVTSGPGADDRTITAYAKDNSATPEYRGLKVVLTKGSTQFGPLMGHKIHLKKRAKIHWGPIYGYDEIKLEGKAKVFFPQLYSVGKITHLDTNAALPNTDGVRWWSFNYTPGVPSWPQLDLEYYKALAKTQGTYYAKGDRAAGKRHQDDDKDSGGKDRLDDKDKSDDDEYAYSNIIDTQPYVRYYEDGVKAKFKGGNNLLRGVIIGLDKVEFKDGTASVAAVNAKYASNGLSAYYPRSVTIPTNAWKHYQKIDTASGGDYPGDSGGPGVAGQAATYSFGSTLTDATHTPAPIHFEGFLYSAKQLKLHKGGAIVGVVMAAHKTTKLEDSDEDKDSGSGDKDNDANDRDHDEDSHGSLSEHRDHAATWSSTGRRKHMSIFFQDNLGIKVLGSGTTQKAWQEIPTTPF